MKKLKLFFACLLMAVLSIGQVWADPAAAGTTLFSENFGSYSADDVPSGSVTTATGRVVYGGANVTYSCTDGGSTTKIYNQNTGGGTAPEILVSKSNGTFVIEGIPSGDAQAITVSWTQNKQEITVAASGTGYSGSLSGKPSAVGTRTFDITVADGADATFTLTFTGSGSSNVRVDDIVVTVKTAGEGATPTCATPTFDPEDGETFSDDIDVEIAAESGTTIYYTTDGEDPTTSSDVYTTALNFTETTTLKAMAVKEGSNNSAVATATYTKVVPFAGSILEITKDDFVASYASNNGEHEKDGVAYYTNQVCLSSSSIQFQKTSGLLYNKTDLGEIAKIEITKTGSNNLVVYSGTTENPSSTMVTGSALGNVTTYTFTSGNGFFAINCNGTGASNVDPIKIYYVYSAPAVVAPTISGETPFSTSTTVSITHADADHIYYTMNGVDPTTSSTEYTGPFTVDADGTTIVKAIAVKGGDVSAVASKEFEKVTSYSSLADIFTKATEVGNTATDIYVTFGGWKVSAKTSNNVFLTDGTNGAVIYGSGHGFNAGDVLTGTVACKVQLYKGFTELTSLNSGSAGLTVTPGSVGDPVTKTWNQLSAVNTGALVTLENLTYDGSSLSDGVNTIPTYTTFYTASFEDGKSYNLTGVYQYYDTDGQILPRSAADVDEIIETFTVTYNNAPENGTLTIKNGDDVVTSGSALNEGTVLTIVTTPAEGYKLVGVTVNGSAYAESTLTLTEDVTIAASFELNQAPLVTSYVLSEIGVETSHLNGEHVGDKVNLPLTAASCSKVFRGWDADADCDHAPTYAPGAEITLAENNKFYAVYATPGDNAATEGFATTSLGSTNTVTDGYAVSAAAGAQDGYYQDGGSVGNKRHVQVMVSNTETQIIPSQPSTITVTAKIGGGSTNDALTNPVYAIFLNASGEEIGDPVELTSAIEVKEGKDYTVNMATSNYANVRGVRIYHVKENKAGSGYNVRYYAISLSYTIESYSDYSTDCQAQVATPTFSPAAGTYTAVQNVEISCETTGATIYYTTNGDEPTTSSTLYEGAITVDESKTLKAIAVKAGMANSAVATAEYTINLPLSTMDQIFAAATAAGGTATDANIAFGNWVVSGVSTNGKNVFVTDGTKGFIIFDNGGEMGFAVGNVLSGTVACKVQLYKGAAELTTLSSATEGLNIATGGSVTPEVKAINALSGINTGAAVTINSVQFDGTNLSDGSNEIKPFNSLFAYDALENEKYYNVTGIYQQFDATKEILPRSAADIQNVDLADPEISYTPASATIELGQSLPGTTFANPHELAISYSSNNEAVATVSNTGVIALGTQTGTAVITASFAGNATYAAANVTYTITVNPASVSENVVILAVDNEKYYAMSTTNASSAFTAIEVEYDGSKVTVNSEADKTAIQWTKKTSEENTSFQTKDETPMYMKGTSSGAAMSLSASVCNWSWDGTNEYYYIGSRSFFYQAAGGYFKNFSISDNMGKPGYSDKAQVIVIAPENIVISSKVDPALAYTPASDEITVGDAWSAPTLGYVEGFDGLAAITYESSNEAVATVTDAGVIALAGGTGTATITATYAGNASYLAGSATYTVKVNEPADVCGGTDDFLDTEDKGSPTSYTDRSTPNGWSAVNAGYKVIEEKAYWMINGKTTAVGVITSPELTGGLGSLKFRYANTNSESNGVSVKIEIKQGGDVVKEYTLTKPNSEVVQNTVYTELIENINVEGTFQIVITNLSPSNNTGNKDRVSIGRFCWTGYVAPEPPVVDYTVVRNDLTVGWYYTMCLDKAVTAVNAGSIWRVLSKAANGTDVILEEVIGTLEAGRPYIFRAAANTLEVAYTGDAVLAPVTEGNNGLVGSFTEELLDQNSNHYIIYNNALYYVNSANVYVGEHRAYLDMTGVPAYVEPQQGNNARRRVTMAVYGKDQAQGFENLDASEKPLKVMIDGTLYILRGEKVYDATGRLVK